MDFCSHKPTGKRTVTGAARKDIVEAPKRAVGWAAVYVVTQQEESDRGTWSQSTWHPSRLAPLVERFWHSRGCMAVARERLFPNGYIELALTLGDRHGCLVGGAREVLPVSGITGILSEPMVIEHPRHHDVIAARLRPAAAYALLGMPMDQVMGQNVDLSAVFGREADELAERCHAASSVEERFRLLAEWIARRIEQSRGVDEAIAWSMAQIESSDGSVSIAELREETGMSKSRLVSGFRRQVGVTPKVYSRIIRFRRACGLLDAGAGSLADVALAAGYYDQPHMNAEFRELAGLTPGEFLTVRYPGGSTAAESVDL
jgi:AraC-like DNA-binding protein